MNFFKKLGIALQEIGKSFRKTKSPKLIMTLLVKNEELLLERNLMFHKSMGVDYFIITDNNSTDNTVNIIKKYQQKGWILEYIEEKGTNYAQKVWVDRMIWMAKTKYHADWVINADADELWYSSTGSLKTELSTTSSNILGCNVVGVYPEDNKSIMEWNLVVKPVRDIKKYDLSFYSVFHPHRMKVLHRCDGYLQIAMGNHKVAMFPRFKNISSTITIYHYTVRGRESFIEKMINGGKQLEKNKKKHVGSHWRYFYRIYKEGRLNEEYDRVVGAKSYDVLCRDGFIRKDSTIVEYFKAHNIL